MAINIIKPQIDTNEYKYITLSNKLNVLLIHDKNTSISSASMTVNVGFYNDPPNAQGLAHFLEHMLFMGTKKYPKENHYGEFINKSGGSTNAHTMEESTTYYFEVLNKYFYELIDIFSNFFIEPLLSENAIEREINAINSEYLKNYPIDIVRTLSALKSLTDNKEHPYNNFGFGNTKTLSSPQIRTTLQDFYNKYYSSNIMNLVVLTNNPITHMEPIITKMFSKIPNKNIPIPNPFPQSQTYPFTKQKFIKVNPIDNSDTLYIFFQLPNMDKYYKYKPLHYIIQLIGHKGNGSLYNILKDNDYAIKVKCNIYESDTSFTLLGIYIKLTQKGFTHYDQVIDCVNTYIKLIQNSPFSDFIIDEMNILNNINFDYSTIDDKITYTSNLSQNMSKYLPEDTIYGDYIIISNNKEKTIKLTTTLIKALNPSSSLIALSSKSFSKLSKLQTDKWFKTEFQISPLPNLNKFPQQITSTLKLPQRNPYMPYDLKPYKSKPTQIITNPNNIWTKFDTFNIPKTFIDLIIYTDEPFKTPENYLLFDMYLALFYQYNHEKLYYSQICDTGYSIFYDVNFITVSFYGYNNNIHKIVELFTSTFLTFINNITKTQFENIKNESINNLKNFIYNPLYEIATDKINNTIYLKNYSNTELQNAIKNITFSDITIPPKWLHKNCNTKTLLYGNFNNDTTNLLNQFNIFQDPTKIITNANQIITLNPGQTQIYIIKSQNPDNDNNLIHLYYEIDTIIKQISSDWELKLLCTHFINSYVREKFFTQLRTKEQSGYIVKSFIKSYINDNGQLYGLSFLVQSPHLSPLILRKRIKKFIQFIHSSLSKLTKTKFDQFKNNIKLMLEQKFESPYDEHEFIFNEILTNEFAFDYKKILINHIDKLTREILMDFYETYFMSKVSRKIRICEIYKQ
jgi:insulysin